MRRCLARAAPGRTEYQLVAQLLARAAGNRSDLDLRKPIFVKTAAYGHFGRHEHAFTWERTDKAEALREAAGVALVAETA